MTTHVFTEPWPKGVTHRYVNQVGATIDITGGGDNTGYRCTGCPYRSGPYWVERVAHEHAQGHAEKCRGLPRPEAAR
ncbi:hypothetical protein ACFCV8_00900 [Streptomyces sp. NPDC056347]|uniref:hypothetical protein n=1 Tax=Streptomyces sp. NPDC056347 TaxID=3345790 RepID=UPI0035DA9024